MYKPSRPTSGRFSIKVSYFVSMLRVVDILLSFAHLALIGFNLTGWIWRRTLKWHLLCVVLTGASWLLLGIWFGLGYCPLTDWQWDVKAKLGATNLPNSFITWFAEKLSGTDISDSLVDTITAVVFALVAALSVYRNFFRKKTT